MCLRCGVCLFEQASHRPVIAPACCRGSVDGEIGRRPGWWVARAIGADRAGARVVVVASVLVIVMVHASTHEYMAFDVSNRPCTWPTPGEPDPCLRAGNRIIRDAIHQREAVREAWSLATKAYASLREAASGNSRFIDGRGTSALR